MLGMEDKTLQKISEPSFITDLCENVISGGSLPNLCALLQIKYSSVIAWIYADQTLAQKYEEALKARSEWFIQSILNELKDIALADVRKAYDENNNLLPVAQWPEALARVVQAVEVSEEYSGQGDERELIGYTKRLKLWDKLRALELLGKNLKMFKEHVEHSGQVSLEDLVLGSMRVDSVVGIPAPSVDVLEKSVDNSLAPPSTPANTSSV